MTIGPKGEITVETLGDLRDMGHGISWHCNDGRCGRSLSLTLDKAIELWGREFVFVAAKWPVRCASCGSKNIGITKTAPDFKR